MLASEVASASCCCLKHLGGLFMAGRPYRHGRAGLADRPAVDQLRGLLVQSGLLGLRLICGRRRRGLTCSGGMASGVPRSRRLRAPAQRQGSARCQAVCWGCGPFGVESIGPYEAFAVSTLLLTSPCTAPPAALATSSGRLSTTASSSAALLTDQCPDALAQRDDLDIGSPSRRARPRSPRAARALFSSCGTATAVSALATFLGSRRRRRRHGRGRARPSLSRHPRAVVGSDSVCRRIGHQRQVGRQSCRLSRGRVRRWLDHRVSRRLDSRLGRSLAASRKRVHLGPERPPAPAARRPAGQHRRPADLPET